MVKTVMPIEIEAKAYTKHLKEIEKKILSMGAKMTWQGEQIDTYYKHPIRDFAATDEALRVREEEGKATLTYKGPKLDTLSKTREELKVRVEDAHVTKNLLEKLGFKEAGMVRKHRMKFFLSEFKVCLDKVENLGEFVEVEASLHSEDSDEGVAALREGVLKTLDLLGLKDRERRSYLELLYPRLH